ncbi:MAG: DUF4340 domain-containing protein [Ruminococcus sp.]|nr:DUF4340 domain-containing protein [Ruminococcus sp.]
MKKAVKGIIGLTAALAVLGGGLAALKLTEPEDTEESTSSSTSEASGSGITLLEDAEIKSVDVKNADDEYTVTMIEKTEEGAAATYTIKGFESLPLSTSVVGTIPNNASGLASTAIAAEDSSSLAKFGLENPVITADIHYTSGKDVTLLIGDTAPNGSDVYVKTSDSDMVYTVASSYLANYHKTVYDLVDKVVLEEPAEDVYPIIKSVRIERDDIDYDMLLEYDENSDDDEFMGGTTATHVMTQPTYAYLTIERSMDITNGMFGLTAEDIHCLMPAESDIAEAGLTDPFCTVTMSCDDGNTYVLKMSEPYTDEDKNTMHYAMLEGTDIIYILSAETAKWGVIEPIDVTSRFVMGTYVWYISDMKLSGKDIETAEIKVTPKENEESENSSSKSDGYTVTSNGEVVDSEHFREFYALLIKAAAEEFALDTPVPDEEPILAITYTESYGNTTQTIEFYEYSPLKALIVIDGESKYFCAKSFAETMAGNVERIGTGEAYVETWK